MLKRDELFLHSRIYLKDPLDFNVHMNHYIWTLVPEINVTKVLVYVTSSQEYRNRNSNYSSVTLNIAVLTEAYGWTFLKKCKKTKINSNTMSSLSRFLVTFWNMNHRHSIHALCRKNARTSLYGNFPLTT